MTMSSGNDLTGKEMHDDQDLYRRLSKEMRHGLKRIYKEISAAAQDPDRTAARTDHLFHEASAQLHEVLNTTQAATESIMDVVEYHMNAQAETAVIIEALRQGTATQEQIDRLDAINETLGNNLTDIMTTLSFQDLTGQRIKKAVAALDSIERTVVELYVSSGLILKGREKDPLRDINELEEEARKTAREMNNARKSHLQGPVNDVSQSNVDELLAQLGME